MRYSRIYLLLFLLFSGCVQIPSTDLAEMQSCVGIDQIVAEAIETGHWKQGEWPEAKWWEKLQDPFLSDLIEKALLLSPTLKKAEAQLKLVYQRALEQKSSLFPEIGLDAQDNWQHVSRYGILRGFIPQIYPPVLNETQFGLNFRYEFDFWGKNRELFQAALGMAEAQGAERLQAELILTTSIASLYIEAQLLLKKKALLEEMNANLKEIAHLRAKRYALDDALIQLQAKAAPLDVEASLAKIKERLCLYSHQLKALSGQNQDAALEIVYQPLHPLLVALPENISLDLVARRPDLMAQKARVEAAAREINAAKTDFYPNLNLSAFLGLDSFFWDKLLTQKSYNGYLNPALHLPIFTAGRIKAHLKEKVEQFNEAVHAYDELIFQAAEEVADQISKIERFHQEEAIRINSLHLVKKQYQLTQKRLEHALENRIGFLNAKNKWLEMELTFTEIEYGKQLSAISLIKALGGGFHG